MHLPLGTCSTQKLVETLKVCACTYPQLRVYKNEKAISLTLQDGILEKLVTLIHEFDEIISQ